MKYKNRRKGFTLVELLAVIAILAVLVIIALPAILDMFREARKNTFITEAKTLYQTVLKQNFLTSDQEHIYSTGSLDLNGGSDLEYSVLTNPSGKITCFQVANSDYMWIYRNNGYPLNNEDEIALEDEITERDYEVILDCSGSNVFDVTVPATFGSSDTWWEGNTDKSQIERIVFTYTYSSNDYDETFYSDGEKVGGLTTYIKDKIAYIVINRNKRKSKSIVMPPDSSNTFSGFTNLKNITGLKLLDFSKVTNMDNFFGRVENDNIVSSNNLTYINGYETFNTSNVTSAKYAFAGVKVSTINLSNWNTKNLTNVTGMFYKSGASTINLSGWNVSKITNYTNMFANNSKLENVNLNKWNTNANADYKGMFNDCPKLVSITAGNGFSVSNTNAIMFRNDTKLIGSNGTTYSTDRALYARVDREDTPGYFSISDAEAIVSAKLYNSGTVSGSYTDLTSSGSVPPDWNYYSGPRLLEVDLYSMRAGASKILEITVPPGMYIVNNSWTTSGKGISNVHFTKLANQGTGSYSNALTGTLKYTFSDSATTSSVQMLVMFDPTIWDKNRKNASAMGTDNMTKQPPITVSYNSGTIVRMISNIHSATAIGNPSDGMGYTFYSWNYNNNIYVDDATILLGNNYLLSRDQSSNAYFYKNITFETYATFKNTSGETVYADVENGNFPSQLSSSFITIKDNVYKGQWNNIYFSSSPTFPRAKYTVKSSDNPKIGSNLTVYIKATVTTLSGQTRTMEKTVNFVIKSKDLDISDLIVGSGNKASPSETYYGDSGYSGILGVFTMYNKGYEDIQNVKVVFEYDTGTAKNTPPSMKVMAARPFLQKDQTVNAKITLVNDQGNEAVAESYQIKSTSNTNGAYVYAGSVAESLNLTGKYYFKKIEYTIPVVSGINKTTSAINYLYNSSGSHSQSSGGNFMGVVSKNSTSKCSVYYGDTLVKTVTSTSSVTNTPAFSGYINKINTPLGTNFTAGDDIELAINVGSVSYPYTNTQAFSKPEVYLVLPFGINIDSVVIANSATANITESNPVVTRVKTIYIGDVLNNVYKITPYDKLWFGYLNLTKTSPAAGQYSSKWFRVKLTTDLSMEYTSINLRDSVYFKDANGHISISGSYAQYSISDKYDVDNDGSTSDAYGTTNNANQIINIYAAEDEDED